MNESNKISNHLQTHSNKELFYVMKTCLHQGTITAFFSVPIVKAKLTSFLSYYNQGDKNDKIPDKKLRNKYSLTKSLQEYIHSLSSWFDMTKENAFYLLEDFFGNNPKKADSLMQREALISTQSDDLREKFQRYFKEFIEEIEAYYYQERLFLIELLLQILDNSFGQFVEDNHQLREEVKDLINNKGLYETLWKQFVSYNTKPIRTQMTSTKVIDYHSIQVLEEQSKILDCMCIIGNYLESFSVPIFNGMIDYYGKTKMMAYGNEIMDKSHMLELTEKFKAMIALIMDKSIIFSLVTFKPKELFVYKNQNSNIGETLKLSGLDYTLLLKYFEASLRETSPEPIHFSIIALAHVLKQKQQQHQQNKPITDFISLVESKKNSINLESGLRIIISIIERYSKSNKENDIKDQGLVYFIYNYKYFIKNWLNLIMDVLFPNANYPPPLINLCSAVLDSELSRDDFYDYDYEVKTPIYNLFLNFINNYSEGNNLSHLLSFCFALLIQYPNISNYNFIFDHLIEPQGNSILSEVLRTWNETNSIMERGEEHSSFKNNIELIRLFIRLITWNLEISTRFILFNKNDNNNESIVDSEIRKLHQTIIDLALYSMTIIQGNREYTMSFNLFINELYYFFVNMNDNYLSEVSSILLENRDKLFSLINVIYATMYNDHYLKDYTNTVLCIRLISTFFSIENILLLASSDIGQQFINKLWNLVSDVIKQFGRINAFESIEECKIIEYIAETLTKVIALVKSSAKKTPLILNNYNTEALIPYFISLINQVAISAFVFNFLRIKVFVDATHSSAKNRYQFRNMFYDKLILKTRKIEQVEAIRSMIRNQMWCFSLMMDIVVLFKGCKENETQSILYSIEFVKEWNNILCVNKAIPSFISDNVNAFNTYDVNLILLLFTYCNYEEEAQTDYDISLDNGSSSGNVNGDEEFNNDNEDIVNINHQDIIKFFSVNYTMTKDLNVSTLSYQVLSKILTIFSLGSSSTLTNQLGNDQKALQQQQQQQQTYNANSNNNNNVFNAPQSSSIPIVNIMNYLSMKKNMGSEIDSNFSLIDKIKQTIIDHFNSNAIYIKCEVIKFLSIAASTQFQFTSSILDDLFSIKDTYNFILEALNAKLDSYDLISLSGLLTMLFAKIFSNDMMYKQTIRLLSKNSKFFNEFLSNAMRVLEVYMKQTNNSFPSLISFENPEFNGRTISNVNKINAIIQSICFSDITIKNLSIIFTKLITLSEIVQKKQKAEFDFSENMFVFLLRFIAPLINNFKPYLPLSISLAEIELRKLGIQIQNKEHVIINDQLCLMCGIDSVFNYGCNFFIDVKELSIESSLSFLRNKANTINHTSNQIMGVIEYVIGLNCHLSLFDSKTQSMFAANYLLGLLYSIGPENYAMTSSFFTNKRLFDQMYSDGIQNNIHSGGNRNINMNVSNNINKSSSIDKIINLNQIHPQFGFLTRDMQSKLKSFIDLIFAEKFLDKSLNRTEQDFDYYSQFIVLNYNIINHFFDFLLYQLKSNRSPGGLNSTSAIASSGFMIQNEVITYILKSLTKDLTYYLAHSNSIEISKLLLSMITLSYSVINYIILSNSDKSLFNYQQAQSQQLLQQSETESILNSLMEKMLSCYETQLEYRAVITYVFSSYCSIPFLKQYPKQNIIFNDLYSSKANIIRVILSKFNDQITDIEYQSFLMLLTNLVNNYSGSFALIQQEKVFFYLKMKNNYRMINEYENNERSHTHLLWCWNLKFVSCVLLNYSVLDPELKLKYYSVYKAAIDHFRNNEERVFKLFDYCGNSNINIQDINNGKAAKSLAFLEEMNQIMNILSAYYLNEYYNTNYSDSDNFEFYFTIIELVLNKGLTLFNMNIKQDKAYQPQSVIEQKMTEMTVMSSSFGFDKDKDKDKNNANLNKENVYDTTYKLVKGYSYVPVSSSSNTVISNSLNSLYLFKVKLLLSRILFNMTNTVSFLKTESQDRSSYLQYIATEYQGDRLPSFDFQCKNVVNASNYADSILFEYNKGKDEYKKYNAINDLFNCNIDTGINFGFINLVDEKEGNADEVLNEMSYYSLTQSLLFEIELNECVNFFTRKYQYSFDVQIKEHLGKCIQFFNKNDISVEKKKEFEELFKEYQGKWNI